MHVVGGLYNLCILCWLLAQCFNHFRNAETGLIATACGDNAIRIFGEETSSDINAPSFSLLAQYREAHKDDVNSIDWNPKRPDLLASASDDGLIKLWRYSTGV